jgi:hypothetical protein
MLLRGRNLIKFAHFSKDVCSTFGWRDAKSRQMNRVGTYVNEARALAAPQRSLLHDQREGAECMEERKPMLPPHKTRELARSLVASEVEANTISLQAQPATVRVYEKLRRQLGAPVGADGFHALASRALALAKVESPGLSAVQIAANGGLWGLGEVESEMNADESGEAGITLIAQLLGLFLTFLGEATTLRLIEDLRLQAVVDKESITTSAETIYSATDGPEMAAAYEDLLLEIDGLRKVSDRIEFLVDKHPGMEEGLLSVAGNIRSIATVLDVFTLIRSKAGGPQEEDPDPETNRYMN